MTNSEMNERLNNECMSNGFTLIDWSAAEEKTSIGSSSLGSSTVTRRVVRVNVKREADNMETAQLSRYLMQALEFPWTLSLNVVK